MKRIKKRLFALLMSFFMTLGIVIGPGEITAAALDETVDLSSRTADYIISESGSYTFSGTLADGYHIIVNPDISGDVNITLNGVKIGVDQIPPKDKTVSALEIGSGTTVNLTVTGVNLLIGANAPGILVPDGATLIIDGAGKLSTKCASNSIARSAAGIGGAKDGTCGTITINGGALIKAIGFRNSAGIGSGYEGSGGSITINGGMVDASSGAEGGGAAIGSGFKATGNCSITIKGGEVRASSIDASAAIGNGYGSTGAKVTITGGSVTATSGGSGAAIGNGEGVADHQSSCTVLISGGTVTATMDASVARMVGAAGIGGGVRGNGCDVTITGGTVKAFGHTGIGPGVYGPSAGSCIVTGGSVEINSINSAEQASVCYDAASTPAYPVSLTVPGITATTAVSYSVNSGSTVTSTTDTDGKLYLWLPAQTNAIVSVNAGSKTFAFSGSVSSTGANTLTTQLSSQKEITAFNFNGLTPAVLGNINESEKTIALTVPYGTDLTALVPTIKHTGTSISPNTGVAQNFSSPVTYTVIAEDGTTQPYIVSVTFPTPAETLAKTLTDAGLTATASGSTVTVTGTKDATDTLALTIPAGVTVLWNASLTGAVDGPLSSLVFLNGDGTFELAGGEITNTGTGMAVAAVQGSMVISGGTASSSNDVATVQSLHMGPNEPTLTMTGGVVTSSSNTLTSCAIRAGGKTVITGGMITADHGKQLGLDNAVVVYRLGLLSKITSGSLSASIAVDPSKIYAMPGETEGLTATGYSATAGNVTAKWAVLHPGEGTGVWVDYTYSGTGSDTWRVSYPAVTVVGFKQTITYDANGGSGSMTGSTVYSGQSYTVSANAFTRTNYNFTGWNTQADGKGTTYAAGAILTGARNSDPITLYAQWSPTGSGNTGGSSGGSSGGGAASTPSKDTPKPSITGDTTTVTTEVKPTTSGTTASATVSKETMTTLIDAALAAAEKSKTTTANVTLAVIAAKDATAVTATVPVASVDKMGDAKTDASLTLQTPLGSVTLDDSALTTIADKATGAEVSVSIAKVDSKSLTAAQQALVGDRPVIDLTVTSAGKTISNLGGTATVSVPYTPAVGEDTSHLVVWYLADNGSLTPMDCSYSNGKLTFSTKHFSKYVVAQFAFSDVKGGDWFYNSVAAMQAKGLMNGTSSDHFAPQATTTRAMIVTMLHRLANQPETMANVNFSDTEPSAYYFNAVKWANEKGIVKGVADDKFAPNGSVTREQLVTILYRYAGSPTVSATTDLSKFSDADEISNFAVQAFAWAIQKGIIGGNADGTLKPTGSATRAEVATMFANYIGVK